MTALLKIPYVKYTGSQKSRKAVEKLVAPKFRVEECNIPDTECPTGLQIYTADSNELVDAVVGGNYVLLFDSEPVTQIVILHDCCFLAARAKNAITDCAMVIDNVR